MVKYMPKTFVTKDSGKRQDYKSGMRRDIQEGKPRYDLVVPLAMEDHMLKRWAQLLERGMTKYGYRNWELADSVEEMVRFQSSAFRHFIQWMEGQEDEDHAAAVFFNIQAFEYVKDKLKLTPEEKTKMIREITQKQV